MHKKQYWRYYSLALGLVLLVALATWWIEPSGVFTMERGAALEPPSAAHWLGTDMFGRDVGMRILYGAHISIGMTVCILVLVGGIGILLGGIAGWYGGFWESLIMRLTDITLAFPSLILAIVVASLLGGGMLATILAIAAVGWARYARLMRSTTLRIKNEEYIVAAQLCGATKWQILWRHIMPNASSFVLLTVFADVGTMMLEVAGLSFLGLGVQAPMPDWGAMVNEGRQYIFQAPWILLGPSVAIFVVVTLCNLWGDALRDMRDVVQNTRG